MLWKDHCVVAMFFCFLFKVMLGTVMVVHQPNMVVVVVVLGSTEKYHVIWSHNNPNYSHKLRQMYSIISCGSWHFHCCVGFVTVINFSDSNGDHNFNWNYYGVFVVVKYVEHIVLFDSAETVKMAYCACWFIRSSGSFGSCSLCYLGVSCCNLN